jgi:hypothetical protein
MEAYDVMSVDIVAAKEDAKAIEILNSFRGI